MSRYKVSVADVPSKERYDMTMVDLETGKGDACYISYQVAEDTGTLLKVMAARFECVMNAFQEQEKADD